MYHESFFQQKGLQTEISPVVIGNLAIQDSYSKKRR